MGATVSQPGYGLLDKFQLDRSGNQSGGMRLAEELPNRPASEVAVVEGVIVDVHPDELVGELSIETASQRHGVIHTCRAMFEPIADALAQHDIDRAAIGRRDVLANDISA